MFQLLNLVSVCLIVVTARSLVLASELCEQDTNWKNNVCIYIRNCATYNRNLHVLVRNKQIAVNEAAFNLRESQNVISIEDLYLELIKYNNIIQGFDSSMRAYMATPAYAQERLILDVANFDNSYLTRLANIITSLGQTVDYMSDRMSLISQPASSIISVSATMKTKDQIYAETYFVTNKMTSLLREWRQKCIDCTSARRRRAYNSK